MSGEVIEGTAVEVIEGTSDEHVIELNVGGGGGPTPFYLYLELDPNDGGNVGIDLDSPWATTHAKYLRVPGTWWLVDKQSQRAVMAVVVQDGDQPYFTKHHVGNLMVGRELIAYGMGKKCADGTTVNNWILPNGIICGGDDVDIIASRMLNH